MKNSTSAVNAVTGLLFLVMTLSHARAVAAPAPATFASDVSTTQWPLAAFDPQLPADWSEYEFLVVEMRASTSQRFELGLVGDDGSVARYIHPFADVWVRASIPLRFYRNAPESADTPNQPRGSYWLSLAAGGQALLRNVRALAVTMRYPAQAATVEIRKASLSKTDPGDAVLEGGTPLVDDFGQYKHAEWPEKARSAESLAREWQTEQRLLVAKSPPACRFGGVAKEKRRASGFFRVENIAGRWWLVDPEGCRFWSAGVDGVGGEPPRTPIIGRGKLFASIPTIAQLPAANSEPDPLRDPVSFYAGNVIKRFGRDYTTPSAQLGARRMRAWGLNTATGPALNEALAPTPTLRQPYVFPLRGWQRIEGAILGMPDVYADSFAKRVDLDVARQLDVRRDDPWMIGYFLDREPAWLGRESQLVDLVLKSPATVLQKRFRSELARGDTPAARKAVVYAAFSRYLEIVDAAVRRHDPNHLNLGIRFGGAPPDDAIALARGFDVISMGLDRWAPPKEVVDRVHAVAKLPVLIDGFHFGVAAHGLAPGHVQVLNQAERGVAYSYYVEHAAEHPAIVGTLWDQWIDEPVTGRADGENYNSGWIDVTDRPYAELVAAAKATHARIDDIHSGKLAATTRKPRASDFGTPEDALALAAPAIR